MSTVKLAIRVRPFSEQETKSEKSRVQVVSVVDEHTVSITNVKVSLSGAGDSRERVRCYTADYTFDSSCAHTDLEYASQEKVFESIGQEVVSSVKNGVSACVLAYGQSATGKTYTMMGTDYEPGLIPRLCRAFAENNLDITLSFLEIYNEKVHDLLAGDPLPCHSLPRRRGNFRKDLRVREHPERGPYVQRNVKVEYFHNHTSRWYYEGQFSLVVPPGDKIVVPRENSAYILDLRRVAVSDLETLLSLVAEGAHRRQTAATKRNSTSSRSHALLELATPRATLHLADLAGSEKASWEGCGGGRQKEGANINKSLVALSNVISALVSGGARGRFVPYRDSALTWLLKDCFTGGSNTFIIATVSPSVACYGESASTLRWAERARQLRTPRTLTSGPTAATRIALQAQLNQILTELAKHHIVYNHQTGKIEFEQNHWNQKSDDVQLKLLKEEPKNETTIGNILNMFNPKPDLQTSESTASSVASESSDVINTIDKNISIKDEISKEVDKLLTPTFERTRSNSDIVVAPLRRRRQYKSQEVLPIDKSLHIFEQETVQLSPAQSQETLKSQSTSKHKTPHVSILYDNQRAEIVASVTERLYTKLKKKEEAAVSKVESMVDKKIMEPLNELKICTNARQKLMEISQRAMRNKKKIGIPAHTQTKSIVTRVKDQGIDVQTDLESYIYIKDRASILQRDVGTETIPMTPRCKEISVGPKCGSLTYCERGTSTDMKQIVHRNSFAMTDVVSTLERCSQTTLIPPPRRKKLTKLKRSSNCNKTDALDLYRPPVISINITQPYQEDTESQSSDSQEHQSSEHDNLIERESHIKPAIVTNTPDLLTNHNNIETSVNEDSETDNYLETDTTFHKKEEKITYANVLQNVDTHIKEIEENLVLFPEECLEEFSLPRVTVASAKINNQNDIRDMILGRNDDVYPYNIILSPPKEKDRVKRIVKFKDDYVPPSLSVASQTSWDWERKQSETNTNCDNLNPEKESNSDDISNTRENIIFSCSDSSDSSKVETDSFVWKNCNETCHFDETNIERYSPVYKNRSKFKSARTLMYKQFLGWNDTSNGNEIKNIKSQNETNEVSSSDTIENRRSQDKFQQRRKFFEDKFLQNVKLNRLERDTLNSCRSLDATVNEYESYLENYYPYRRCNKKNSVTGITPRQYLQQLVQLRREVIRSECDTTDSSIEVPRK